jgi:hypothetical protein
VSQSFFFQMSEEVFHGRIIPTVAAVVGRGRDIHAKDESHQSGMHFVRRHFEGIIILPASFDFY